MRLGLLGGTFDPVHMGHLLIAKYAAEQLHLAQVWFVPARQPWMRSGQPLTLGHHRVAMVELAIRSKPQFALCTLEVERPGDTYTVDTLEELRAERGPQEELFFIMGADTLQGFHRWKAPERILELATVVVVMRPGHTEVSWEVLESQVPGVREAVVLLRTPLVDISSTEVRRRVSQGLAMGSLVPDAVAEYIEAIGLYRLSDGSPPQVQGEETARQSGEVS